MVVRFIVGCGAIVTGKDKKMLMVRQQVGYWAGKWIFPGGKLEMGETLEGAARREVLEENGLQLRDGPADRCVCLLRPLHIF